jgi:RHS repeat-associated protein
MQTTAAGNQEEECYSYPFGDGLTCTGTDATEHHFTSKERDSESGLDYFGARYLSSDLGRFMTPDWAAKPTDVPYATFGDPQTLNLYAYVGNNPLGKADADGHDWNAAWHYFAAAVTQMSVTVTTGLGAEIKGAIGGKGSAYNVRGGIAIKDNIKFSNGTLSATISGNIGVSAGKQGGTRIGLEGSAEKQVASVNVGTGEAHLGGPGTTEKTVGVSHGDTTGTASSEGGFSIGSEAGEGAIGGGNFSITKEGVSDLKSAAGEAWSSIKGMFGGGSDGSSSSPSPSSTSPAPPQTTPQNPDNGGQAPH